MKGRGWVVLAIVVASVLSPTIALAATGAFTSSTSTPAVKGTSSYSGGKGVAGYATSTSSTSHIGVYGSGSGTGGFGLYGTGSKYGVYSNGPLGVASGKALVCTGCVGATALAATAQPSVVSKDGNTSVSGSVGNTCTNLGTITVTAAAAGKVTVDADVHLNLNHTVELTDWFQAMVSTSAGDCTLGSSLYAHAYVDGSQPTSTDYKQVLHVMETFTVATGSHTYYVNVKWPFGGDAGDSAYAPNLRAMFFPS